MRLSHHTWCICLLFIIATQGQGDIKTDGNEQDVVHIPIENATPDANGDEALAISGSDIRAKSSIIDPFAEVPQSDTPAVDEASGMAANTSGPAPIINAVDVQGGESFVDSASGTVAIAEPEPTGPIDSGAADIPSLSPSPSALEPSPSMSHSDLCSPSPAASESPLATPSPIVPSESLGLETPQDPSSSPMESPSVTAPPATADPSSSPSPPLPSPEPLLAVTVDLPQPDDGSVIKVPPDGLISGKVPSQTAESSEDYDAEDWAGGDGLTNDGTEPLPIAEDAGETLEEEDEIAEGFTPPAKRNLDVRISRKTATVVTRAARLVEGMTGPQQLTFTLRRAGWFNRRAIATFLYNSGDVDGKRRVKFEYEVLKVIEYLPGDTEGDYRPGVSTKVKELKPKSWGPFQYEVAEGQHRIIMTTSDGRLQLVATFNSGSTNNFSAVLDPNIVQLETHIVRFPYRRHDSRLCLVADIKSNTNRLLAPNGETVLEEDGGPLGRFLWVPEARAHDNHQIHITTRSDWGGRAQRRTKYHGLYYCSLAPAPSDDSVVHSPPSVMLMLSEVNPFPAPPPSKLPEATAEPVTLSPQLPLISSALTWLDWIDGPYQQWLMFGGAAVASVVGLSMVAGMIIRRMNRPRREEYQDIL